MFIYFFHVLCKRKDTKGKFKSFLNDLASWRKIGHFYNELLFTRIK